MYTPEANEKFLQNIVAGKFIEAGLLIQDKTADINSRRLNFNALTLAIHVFRSKIKDEEKYIDYLSFIQMLLDHNDFNLNTSAKEHAESLASKYRRIDVLQMIRNRPIRNASEFYANNQIPPDRLNNRVGRSLSFLVSAPFFQPDKKITEPQKGRR